jgi:hypothetical protein
MHSHSHFLSFLYHQSHYHYRYTRTYIQTMFFSEDLLSSKKGSYVIPHQEKEGRGR